MDPHEEVPADRLLEVAQRIADRLLELQDRVNRQMDATASAELPEIRRQLGYGTAEPVDLDGLVNTRIAGVDIVVTPEAVATVLPVTADSAATTRAGRRAVADVLNGADGRGRGSSTARRSRSAARRPR